MCRIVVLPDGETYSDIRGCKVAILDEEQMEEVESGATPRQLDTDFETVDIQEMFELVGQISRFSDVTPENMAESLSAFNLVIEKARRIMDNAPQEDEKKPAVLAVLVEDGCVTDVVTDDPRRFAGVEVRVVDFDCNTPESVRYRGKECFVTHMEVDRATTDLVDLVR